MKEDIKQLLSMMIEPSSESLVFVTKAYFFAEKCYGSKANKGISCFSHAFETARIVADPKLDLGKRAIATALLHDILIETSVTEDEIKNEFGKEILFLLQRLKALSSSNVCVGDKCKDSLVKFLLAYSGDLRVLIIKLAERLALMRSAEILPLKFQLAIAKETMGIYVPLAERLGIGNIKRELETISFRILNPKEYLATVNLIRLKEQHEKKHITHFKKSLLRTLAKERIPILETDFRLKSVYSVYKKLKIKIDIQRIHDMQALRVLVKSLSDCYRVLSAIHSRWQPVQGRMKDYISSPKPDGYQSLHTTVFTNKGKFIEIQIRTPAMHKRAELGIITHNYYKQKEKNPVNQWFSYFFPPPKNSKLGENDLRLKKVPAWVRQLVDVRTYVAIETNFSKNFKSNFFDKQMFVFSESGEVVDLPKNATAIDFAFALDPQEAFHLSGVKVNEKFSPIDKKLNNGDIIELHTKKSARPTLKWFQHAKTAIAKNHISEYLNSKQEFSTTKLAIRNKEL